MSERIIDAATELFYAQGLRAMVSGYLSEPHTVGDALHDAVRAVIGFPPAAEVRNLPSLR